MIKFDMKHEDAKNEDTVLYITAYLKITSSSPTVARILRRKIVKPTLPCVIAFDNVLYSGKRPKYRFIRHLF